MIDDIYSRFHNVDPDIGIACLYADYKDQNNQTLVHILGCFLHQLLTTPQKPILDGVIDKLKDIQKRNGKVGSDDIIGFLKIRLQQLKRSFICIDAVDELEPKVQRQILDAFKELGTNNTRVFLTGRGHIEIEIQKHLHAVEKEYRIVISASEEDIQKFVVT